MRVCVRCVELVDVMVDIEMKGLASECGTVCWVDGLGS